MLGLFTDAEFVKLVAYVLIGAGAFIITHALVREQETRQAQESLEDRGDRQASDPFVKLTRPIFSQYIVPMIRGKGFWDEKRKEFRRKLISAGLSDEMNADEFIAFKIVLIVFFPVIGGLLKSFGLIDFELHWIFASGVAGWFYPNFWVKQRIDRRHSEIFKAMPFIVDLLALSTEAGLDFVGAMGKVVEKSSPSPLVDEISQVLKEIKIGSSRAEALREMALRINMPEIGSFVAILISADQMGASIGKVLRQQTDSIRNNRFVRAEKAGAAAASKLMIPIVLIILPAVLLMVMGPFVLGFIYGGNTGF